MAIKSLFAYLVTILMLVASSCSLQRGYLGSSTAPHTETHSTSKDGLRLRNDISKHAKKHVGVKYRYGGKTPAGFDCSGFVTYVMGYFDVPVSGPSYTQEKLGKKISKENAKAGDLVFFRKSRAGKVYHVAMVYSNDRGNLSLIHSTSSRGVVIDKLDESSYWRSKVMTVRDVISGK